MKKFIKKVCIGFVIVVAIFFVLNALYIRTEYYRTLNSMEKFDNIPAHIDIANFGASHSQAAFDWTPYQEQLSGVNLALGSQTLVYDEAIFNTYQDRFDENSVVILEVMFKSLYESNTYSIPYPSKITRYYKILPKEYFPVWSFEDAVAYKYFPLLGNRQSAIYNMVKELFMKIKSTSDGMDASNEVYESDNQPTQVLEGFTKDSMDAEGSRRAQSFIDLCGEQELGSQYDSLIKIIEKCQERRIKVLLVTAPTLPCFYESYPEEFMSKFYSDINSICKAYHVEYIDYTGDERMLKDYRWYLDTDHLNSKGSEMFMKYFLEDNKQKLFQ